MHQYATLEDTVYFWFAANDTSGTGADGETPVFDVRLAGAAADAAPVLSGAATLLSHANYPAGCHEIAVAATAVNGFAAGSTYAVFCTLLVDSQNPTGFHGSFTLGRIPATCPDTQKVDLNTIKTQTVTAAAPVTFPGSVGDATATELAKVPKSDGTATWNNTALASINAEVDTALNTAIPGSPTADSINERVATMDGRILGTLAAGTHTAQSGDGYDYLVANLGATGANATEAGGTGDHLTAVPWNATWDAEVESEVNDALTAFTADTGIALPKALEMLAAFMAGKVSASSAGGITTYTYKKRDGTTTSFTAACSETDGTRATTGSLS